VLPVGLQQVDQQSRELAARLLVHLLRQNTSQELCWYEMEEDGSPQAYQSISKHSQRFITNNVEQRLSR